MKINIKVFYKLIPSFLVVIARQYAQCIQNNKFALSLHYFNKEIRYKADFFIHADKYQNFLQADTLNFDGHGHSRPKYPKHQGCKLFAIFQGISER